MNTFKELFDQQKRYFATGTTRSHEWRVEQLDRMARLVGENEIALQQAIAKDFKTASQEQIFLGARQLVRRSSTQATFRTGSGSWRSGSSRS